MAAPILARAKTVIRTPWLPRVVATFRAGHLVPVFAGSRLRPLAIVRLTSDPRFEPISAAPDGDYDAEGWRWLYEHPDALIAGARREEFSWAAFEQRRQRSGSVWAVRFVLVGAAATGSGTPADPP